jgi:electron transport complex protein RnfC
MLEYTAERHLTGGLRLAAHKAHSTARPISHGLMPRQVILGVKQHRGAPAVPVVAAGQRVLKGQTVASPGPGPSAAVHASTSGTVRGIESRLVPLGNALRESLCIIIDTDGKDEAAAPAGPEWPAARDAQLQRIRDAGLAGLGGAVFPTADKLALLPTCEILIINGAECEPYISCDDMLMREAPRQIVEGALLMADLLDAARCIIAIERDKPRAIEAIGTASRALDDARLSLAELPTIYPAGGERQLIEVLTGKEVPSGAYPNELGYVCHNVGTAYALQRLARAGEPLTSRIVTVTGTGVTDPQNVEVPIGTPIAELIAFCGGYTNDVARLILGGSMMGYALPSDDLPVTKATNCIIAACADEIRDQRQEWTCIRCGECSNVCPARLLPQELHRAAAAGDHAALLELGLDDCIECGCCDVVCPSHIPLTERFRGAKIDLLRYRRQLALSEQSEQRFRDRQNRLDEDANEERQLQDRLIGALHDAAGGESAAIAAAVERARRRRRGGTPDAE